MAITLRQEWRREGLRKSEAEAALTYRSSINNDRGTSAITGHRIYEDIRMNDIDSREGPIFLDKDDESLRELPLMVTRNTLRSIGLTKTLLEQLSAGATTDEQLGTSKHTNDAPSGQVG